MATKVIENSNTRLFGLIFFGKMALIYLSNWPKPFGKRKSRDSVHDVFRLQFGCIAMDYSVIITLNVMNMIFKSRKNEWSEIY